MVKITTEQIEQNYSLFLKKLSSLGVETKLLEERLGDKLKNATYSISTENSSVAFDGSLLHVVLRTLTPMALEVKKLLGDKADYIDNNSLIKVCLLFQISKAEMFEPNTNEWEIKNRGILYKYTKQEYALKMGMWSLIICQECGISLTRDEIEAMTAIDRESETQTRFYASPFANIIISANNLTNVKIK